MNSIDWIANIENLADMVAETHGYKAVRGVYSRYGASSVSSLSPSCYGMVFSDLQYLTTDN